MMTTGTTPGALGSHEQLGPLPDCYSRFKHEAGVPLYSADQMRAYAAEQVAAERERCAKLCEAIAEGRGPGTPGVLVASGYNDNGFGCAAAIREQGPNVMVSGLP